MKGKLILLVAVVGSCLNSAAIAEEKFTKESYVDSVISVLHAHADAIENLNEHRIKYSNNLVRHAAALEHTFGLLGPMDWHAAQSVTIMMEKGGQGTEEENHERFDELQKRATSALKGVVVAARRTLEEDEHDQLKVALDRMKQACNNCHMYLPEDVAPDIWGNLERK